MAPTDLTGHWIGLTSLALFAAAYVAVMAEERLHLRKSQPVLVAAGLIWLLIGVAYAAAGDTHAAAEAARHNLLEYGELFLFVLVALTFVNTMTERGVFDALRAWLLGRGLSWRALFWATGALAFVLSPIADNLTTALVMGTVAVTLATDRPRFVALACINIVVAANAGGAFSPFGDITTLMVWQRGHVDFIGFLPLFVPSLANWLVPAAIMSFAVDGGRPEAVIERPALESGAVTVVLIFVGTIATTVVFHNSLHLPPAVGMMAGLGALKLYGYLHNSILRRRVGNARHSEEPLNELHDVFADSPVAGDPLAASGLDAASEAIPSGGAVAVREREIGNSTRAAPSERAAKPLNTFEGMERVEWDTLMFFYGVMMGVGGLGALGYLALAATALYGTLGPTGANILIGLLSAVIDNVPVMFAVLSMNLDLSRGQWLLVTLTAGVGGSLLSIGSAAGVALMGQARGAYTFASHLRWSWAVGLGYLASIALHLLLNRTLL